MTTPITTIEETYDISEGRFTGRRPGAVPADSERNHGEPDRLLASALEAAATCEGSDRLTEDRLTEDRLTEDDRAYLESVLGHEVSENTRKNYDSQWRRFAGWANERGTRTLPAEPLQVAAYLAERLEKHGHKPATLQTAAAAIGFVHRAGGAAGPVRERGGEKHSQERAQESRNGAEAG